jgi:plasmid stabilization system protein ParE
VRYTLHPEARRDLRDAARFYRDQSGPARAQALLSEFEHSVGLLLEYPELGSPWLFGKRRLLFRHFPFGLIYKLTDDRIRILAVAHLSRRQDYWRDRE